MEVVFTAIAIFAAGVLLINKFIFEPEKQAEVTTEDRMKMQINALENKIKVMTDIESRFQILESKANDALERLEHAEHNISDVDKFSKANHADMMKTRDRVEGLRMAKESIEKSLKKLRDYEVPEIMTVKLEEFKKPLAVALNQTRAQRPVRVTWKKGHKGWKMVDKTIEYSRAEYLKKLKKQGKKHETVPNK